MLCKTHWIEISEQCNSSAGKGYPFIRSAVRAEYFGGDAIPQAALLFLIVAPKDWPGIEIIHLHVSVLLNWNVFQTFTQIIVYYE